LKKILLLSSDTAHHRYFINSIESNNIIFTKYFFETIHYEPSFKVGPIFEREEGHFESNNFFQSVSNNILDSKIIKVDSINSDESIKKLNAIKPDLGIVFGTGKINNKVISIFKDGLINVHRGLAEKYRGLDSDLWAIYHRDYDNIGVTIHMVDSVMDAGNIIFSEKLKISSRMKTHQLRYYTTLMATDLIKSTIIQYLNNNLNHRVQSSKGRYYSFMPKELKKIVNIRFNKYCEKL